MPYCWPEETVFREWVLEVDDRSCLVCGRKMHVCDHRHHRIFTLDGPVHLICRLVHCPERLGKRVRLWISDKQDAFLSGIAAEFPGVPHRYCENHFLRDVAQPVLEMARAKVQMRGLLKTCCGG